MKILIRSIVRLNRPILIYQEKSKKISRNFDQIFYGQFSVPVTLFEQSLKSLRDELKNQTLEEKHSLRIQLEGAVENLWKQFQAAQKQYNESTQERRKEFEKLQR